MLFDHQCGSGAIQGRWPGGCSRKAGGNGGGGSGGPSGDAGGDEGATPKEEDGCSTDVGDAIRSRITTLGLLLVSGLALGPASPAAADLVAGWNFNDAEPTSGWIAADLGDAWIDLGVLSPSSDLYEGTEMNAPFEWRAGDAMGLQGGGVESGSILIGLDLGNGGIGDATSLQLSYVSKRSRTGFDQVAIESWSKGGWKPIASSAIGTAWGLHEASGISVDSMGRSLLRLTMGGSTSAAGTIRFDNLLIESVPVPGPAVASVLGVGGLARSGDRRRR